MRPILFNNSKTSPQRSHINGYRGVGTFGQYLLQARASISALFASSQLAPAEEAAAFIQTVSHPSKSQESWDADGSEYDCTKG
jgi:hypothetical protein